MYDVLRAAERGAIPPAEGIRAVWDLMHMPPRRGGLVRVLGHAVLIRAAFTVAALTFVLADTPWADADLRAMVAPLVTFLPGAMLTMAVVELSAAEMITGASRLVSGSLQLVLLAFGIIGAAQTVGVPRAEELQVTARNSLGAWAPGGRPDRPPWCPSCPGSGCSCRGR